MEKENNKLSFWNIIGKIGVIVGVCWGSIQIYNYFFHTEFKVEATGRHTAYETSPTILKGYNKSLDYIALSKTLETTGIKKDSGKFSLDTLLIRLKKDDYTFQLNRDLLDSKDSLLRNGDYSSMWTINVINTGNKSYEELALELPFKGYYKIYYPNNVTKSNFFQNKIELGELRPSYQIKIRCWIEDTYYGTDYNADEEKSRFTHKNGSFNISYPTEATGFYLWNKKNYGSPLLIFSAIIIFFMFLLYSFAEFVGVEKGKKMNIEEENEENKSEKPESTK